MYLGPQDVNVLAIAEVDKDIWIGTTGRGLMRYDRRSGAWQQVGFRGKWVHAIQRTRQTGAIWVTIATPYPDTVSAVAYITRDGGDTWMPRDGGIGAADPHEGAEDLVIHPDDVRHLLMSIGSHVVRTTDEGETWTAVIGGTGDSMLVSPLVYSAVAFGGSGSRIWIGGGHVLFGEQVAYRSDDGGDTWLETSRPGSPGRPVVGAFLPDASDADATLAAVAAQVVLTTDAGASWRPVLDLPYSAAFGFVANDTVIVAVGDEARSGTANKTNLGLYRAASLEAVWDTVATPREAWGGRVGVIDRLGQLVIGTRAGVWLVQR